ncbi:MAG TPA: hypothetical protein VGD40_12955 [Chryseosolibacter sp.]
MLRIIERIGELLLSQQERALELRELKVQFVRDRNAIVHHLKICKKSKGVIGLYATRLGRGMFLGTITSIHRDVITLRPIEVSDHDSHTIMLPLNEVTAICPFNQIYSEPEETDDEMLLHADPFPLAHSH